MKSSLLSFISRSSLLAAYKHADGKKIDGRRVLVDVERGRTVKGWHPRRLGKVVVYTQMYFLANVILMCSCIIIFLFACFLLFTGGGLGGTRRGGADVNIKHSGRDDTSRYDDRPIGG